MFLDLLIVAAYFSIVFIAAIRGKLGKDATAEEYFLNSRSLKWPSIAISTIATNIQGYQFLGMMGSAYLFGLAQANLEINAITGLWMAAFIFVPLYLKDKCITITQFIKKRLGPHVALAYSGANLLLFSTLGLGAALFWGAYAADLVFGDILALLSQDRMTRIAILIVFLGVFSAIYTYFGGLGAVVRTDLIQFGILFFGGVIVMFLAVYHLGGWGQLYKQTPDLMHLHLPADHDKLPWIGIVGMILLNINYWGANQTVIQRSLAAKSLKEAQKGLMVGGLLKVVMAVIIIVPGIALAGILGDNPLNEPDQTFPYLVTEYLPEGLRGVILCALFASLMSTVDSLFNSLSTLWSIDIYKTYINKSGTDRQVVAAGRNTILVTLVTGVLTGFLLLYVKLENPEQAFTHVLNEFNYYIKSGIAALISVAVFLLAPKHRLTLFAFLFTVPLHIIIKYYVPEMNYFVRSSIVILIAFAIVAIPSLIENGIISRKAFIEYSSKQLARAGGALVVLLVVLHIVFH
ncbi:MAG: sodium/solute symporter [Bacteroidota bacterium]